MGENLIVKIAVLFMILSTCWLLASRIRSCFRAQPERVVRDLALLYCGPATAIIVFIIKAAAGVRAYVEGGIDADFGLRYLLAGSVWISVLGLLCLVLGTVAVMLPQKRST